MYRSQHKSESFAKELCANSTCFKLVQRATEVGPNSVIYVTFQPN